jgi:two-component system response regulator MprA
MRATRVLVVEDDHALRRSLSRGLAEHGLDVSAVPDGTSALDLATGPDCEVDVIVLDIGLPDSDGRDVCQAMRARGVVAPVLFLTARGQVGDRVSGFAAGGDDYLAKPFHFVELVARVTALARRGSPSTSGSSDGPHLDPAQHSLVTADATVALTPTEFRILAVLMGAPDRVHRRRELIAAAWPAGAVVNDNTLDQYVARIRRKLQAVPAGPSLATVHGVGYRLT